MKRVIAIIGVGPLLHAIRACVPGSAPRPCHNLTIEVGPPSSANAFSTASTQLSRPALGYGEWPGGVISGRLPSIEAGR
jgi:hypothetical protein